MADPSQSVSELLARWRAGDEESLQRLIPIVYDELRRLAHFYLRRERRDHTLQTTGLVHEAYLSLARQQPIAFENRSHFFAVCARLMRQVLVQYARRRNAAKRDGGFRLDLDNVVARLDRSTVDVVALDDALDALEKLDARQCQVVEMRFFGGLSIEETSHVLGISPATVKRDWATARLWLQKQMDRTKRDDA